MRLSRALGLASELATPESRSESERTRWTRGLASLPRRCAAPRLRNLEHSRKSRDCLSRFRQTTGSLWVSILGERVGRRRPTGSGGDRKSIRTRKSGLLPRTSISKPTTSSVTFDGEGELASKTGTGTSSSWQTAWRRNLQTLSKGLRGPSTSTREAPLEGGP